MYEDRSLDGPLDVESCPRCNIYAPSWQSMVVRVDDSGTKQPNVGVTVGDVDMDVYQNIL